MVGVGLNILRVRGLVISWGYIIALADECLDHKILVVLYSFNMSSNLQVVCINDFFILTSTQGHRYDLYRRECET
jgi:hypothetical protein